MRKNMDEKPAQRERKAPKKISKKYLENAALFYLRRYATSAENLKRILLHKIKKSCTFHQAPVEDFIPLVDELVARYIAVGLIDDAVFARGRVTSLRRQGLSKQAIMGRLQSKGLSPSKIEEALRRVDAEQGDPEIAAAIVYARRKKLGPWRKQPLADQKSRLKELAVLGRAGFSYDVARRALKYTPEE
ncbi:MAG: regulatory protein RecX [Proteobacteria bacterium]|nr:regulatory protein RecX [Pseudomonadota bacterium]